jgi:hypothetical protein
MLVYSATKEGIIISRLCAIIVNSVKLTIIVSRPPARIYKDIIYVVKHQLYLRLLNTKINILYYKDIMKYAYIYIIELCIILPLLR